MANDDLKQPYYKLKIKFYFRSISNQEEKEVHN